MAYFGAMGSGTVNDERLARDLCAAVVQRADPDEIGAEFSRLIAPIVAHDALSLVGTDPVTGLGLGSFSFWHAYDPELADALIMHRYTHGDSWRAAAVARTLGPVGIAGRESEGPPLPLRDDILAAHGVGSEMRLVLRDGRGVWGILGLLRFEGRPPFGADAERRVRMLGPALMETVRRYALAGPLCSTEPAPPAGVIMIGADHRIRTVSPQARAWLDLIAGRSRQSIPAWVPTTFLTALSLSARLRARHRRPSTPLVSSPPVVCGRWVVCQGEVLDPSGGGEVALVIQGPSGDLVLPSFCSWHGITPREREVVAELRTGAAAKQIARRLGLSVYTVNDHLKAVFQKTG
ncbi:helix-turn-helix transcriptional regulator, partial [Streptomyces sp. NPDC055078]